MLTVKMRKNDQAALWSHGVNDTSRAMAIYGKSNFSWSDALAAMHTAFLDKPLSPSPRACQRANVAIFH